MRLLLIRHGDPDYAVDGLTETGRREAALLAERIAPMEISEYYVSTMGRALETARPSLEKAGREALACDWLREFDIRVRRPDCGGELSYVPWDWLPQDWLADPILLDPFRWHEHPVFASYGVREAYDRVCAAFDEVLAGHGYVRDGLLYRVMQANSDTLVFFCHLGLSCVLLSHLMHCSPMVLWHGLAPAPSSVTTVVSEERRPGIVSFRASAIGDVSHLAVHGQPPSFSARFCEIYGNGERQD
jgi:probable phosphoglycerate mutase